jgi:hypothetical protein
MGSLVKSSVIILMTTWGNSHIVKVSNTEDNLMTSRFSQLIKDLEENDRQAREVEAKVEALNERVIEVNQEVQELNDVIGWLEIQE